MTWSTWRPAWVLLACLAARSALGARTARRDSILPVTKVVQLLKAMQQDLERELKEDEETHERLTCWCDSNKKERTASIETAKQTIDTLEATIEASASQAGELTTELAQTKADIASNEAALAAATELRQKEAAAFHEQEKELLQSLQLLRGAITALAKHHPAMLQAGSALAAMKPALRHLVHKHLNLLGWLRTSEQRAAFLDFLAAHDDILEPDFDRGTDPALLQRSAAAQPIFRSYAPQSGQVMGILRQMEESFEAELPQVQQEERQKQTAFVVLRDSKRTEIARLKEQLRSKTAALAEAKETLASAKADLEDTRAALSADQRFLLQLQETCQEGQYEWERRSKMRAAEIQAVAEAIEILTTDLARDGQQTTFGLLQLVRRRDQSWRRRAAVALLQRAPSATPLILAAVREEPMAKVITAIDKLVAELKAQQAEEVQQRDACTNQLHENEVESQRTEAHIERLGAQVEELRSREEGITSKLAELKSDIAELQVELQRASEQRRSQNLEFRRTSTEQAQLQAALREAHARLADFYVERQGVLLQQRRASPNATTTSAAPQFQDYHDHAASNSVMTLLEKLAGDAKVLADATIHDEQTAQRAYEELILQTNAAVRAKVRAVADSEQELASVREERHATAADKTSASQELEALSESAIALHQQCDFLLRNFGARQDARAAEMEALQEVKAVLRGMQSS